MAVAGSTFREWKGRFPALSAALKNGRRPVDIEVENAMLKLALGYTVTVKEPVKLRTERQLKDKGKIVEERVEMVEREIYVKPESVNQFFWLKNRRPDKWRDKPKEAEKADDDPIVALLSRLDAEAGVKARTPNDADTQ